MKLENFKKTLGKRLRETIKEGYGEQKEAVFAKRVGIAQGTLSEMLNGKICPSAYTLFKIWRKTGISIDALFKGE